MVACWNYTAGYNVFESGAKLEDIVDETFMFMPNHQVRVLLRVSCLANSVTISNYQRRV